MKLHPLFYFFIFFIFVSKNLISQIIIVDSSLRILEDNTLFINPIYNSKKSFEEELKKKFKKELRKVSYLGCNITLYKYKYPSKITFTSRIGQRESIAFKDLKRKVNTTSTSSYFDAEYENRKLERRIDDLENKIRYTNQ